MSGITADELARRKAQSASAKAFASTPNEVSRRHNQSAADRGLPAPSVEGSGQVAQESLRQQVLSLLRRSISCATADIVANTTGDHSSVSTCLFGLAARERVLLLESESGPAHWQYNSADDDRQILAALRHDVGYNVLELTGLVGFPTSALRALTERLTLDERIRVQRWPNSPSGEELYYYSLDEDKADDQASFVERN
jgi:hypothetical protein